MSFGPNLPIAPCHEVLTAVAAFTKSCPKVAFPPDTLDYCSFPPDGLSSTIGVLGSPIIASLNRGEVPSQFSGQIDVLVLQQTETICIGIAVPLREAVPFYEEPCSFESAWIIPTVQPNVIVLSEQAEAFAEGGN